MPDMGLPYFEGGVASVVNESKSRCLGVFRVEQLMVLCTLVHPVLEKVFKHWVHQDALSTAFLKVLEEVLVKRSKLRVE